MFKVKIKFIFLAIRLFGFFGLVKSSQAADYYVSPTGAATWANCGVPAKVGTAACSWQTAMANAVAGDTVYFRGGTYTIDTSVAQDSYDPPMKPAHSGTAGNLITFQAFSGEHPLIVAQYGGGNIFGVSQRNYITWDGFTTQFTGTTRVIRPMVIYIANNIVVRNCEFIGSPHRDHQNTSGIQIDQSSYIYVFNNKFHGMTRDPNPIEGVVNTGAVWFMGTDHMYFYNNEIYDTDKGFMLKVHPSYVYVYNNYFHDMTGAAYAGGAEPSSGTDYFFYQNVVVNTGGLVYSPDPSGITYNLNVYNNTVYNGGGVTLCNPSYQNNRNTKIYNNIFSGSGVYLNYCSGAGLPDYSNYNNFYGSSSFTMNYYTSYSSLADWQSNSSFDLNSITSDPLFVNAGGTNPADYKLQAGSLAKTSGRGGSYATIMGAYIVGDETIGYTAPESADTTPPAAPSGLAVN